jgi:hypothetical protein
MIPNLTIVVISGSEMVADTNLIKGGNVRRSTNRELRAERPMREKRVNGMNGTLQILPQLFSQRSKEKVG